MRRGLGTAALAVGVLLTSCSSGAQHRSGALPATGGDAVLPGTEPYVQMTSEHAGYLVWPSGKAWVLLATTTGFRQIGNRTPIAVDTEGGLIGDFSAAASAVAVGATGALYRSPLLTSRSTNRWNPAELPGAISNARNAIAVVPQSDIKVSAITTGANGTLVVQQGTGWRALTSGRRLDTAGRLTLDSVTWLNRRVVVLAGHGQRGVGVAQESRDGGRTWRALPGLASDTVAALPACATGSGWALPTLTASGTEIVMRTSDAGARWQAGHPLHAQAGTSAIGCSGTAVWAVGEVGQMPRIAVSTDAGRSWQTTGTPPSDLTSLAPTGGGTGFATSGGSAPKLWRVLDNGHRFVRIRLPGWVASLGAQMSTS